MNLGPPLPSFAYGSTAPPAHVNACHSLSIKRVKSAEVCINVSWRIQRRKKNLNTATSLPMSTMTSTQASSQRTRVDTACKLSRVRIHVERVIRLLRQKFTILESTLPINMIMCTHEDNCSMIDKIVTVCSALCNCCESVVPFD